MKRLIGLCLSVATIALVLLVAEATLRFGDWYRPPNAPVRNRRPDLYQADPAVGYRLWPSMVISYRYPVDRPDLIPITSNSAGYRNTREFDEPDDRRRILVLGDSFVFGDGVRAEERLTEVMESLRPDWRVDNMGMSGYGLDLMIRSLEHHVEGARPDVVVLCLYTDDFRRLHPYYAGVGFTYDKFELRQGSLISVPSRVPGWLERTRLAQAWLRVRWDRNRNRYDLHEALLNRFLEDARRYGFRPATAFLPGRGDTREDKERRGFLRRWAEGHGVSHVDLTAPIHDAGVERVYIERNFHWNAMGHRIAAERLVRLLDTPAPTAR